MIWAKICFWGTQGSCRKTYCYYFAKRHGITMSCKYKTPCQKVIEGSDRIREASLPKKQKWAQGSMSDEYTKSFCVKISWKWGTCITPNTPRSREHCVWAERRIFRTEDYGGPWQNSVFCIWQGQGTHGVMPPVLACPRVAQSSQSTFQQGRSMDSHYHSYLWSYYLLVATKSDSASLFKKLITGRWAMLQETVPHVWVCCH